MKKRIWITVCILHCLSFFALLFQHLATHRKPLKPMLVKTYIPPPATQKIPPSKTVAKAPPPKKTTAKPLQKAAPKIEKRPSLTLPSKIAPQIKTEEPRQKTLLYEEFLIPYLQNCLDLPEYGEVKAEIALNQFGMLLSFTVLDAKSSQNAEFLRHEIFKLSFPPLRDFGITEPSKTFTIIFRNLYN